MAEEEEEEVLTEWERGISEKLEEHSKDLKDLKKQQKRLIVLSERLEKEAEAPKPEITSKEEDILLPVDEEFWSEEKKSGETKEEIIFPIDDAWWEEEKPEEEPEEAEEPLSSEEEE